MIPPKVSKVCNLIYILKYTTYVGLAERGRPREGASVGHCSLPLFFSKSRK